MAKVINNIITKGLKGQLGDQIVFRQLYGETILSNKGMPSGSPTLEQQNHRNSFASAVIWAKANKNNAVYIAASSANKRKFPGGYHAALHDALTPPDPTIGRSWKNGSLVFGADDTYADGVDSSAIIEYYFRGLTVSGLSLEMGIASNEPKNNQGFVTMKHALQPVDPSLVNYILSPDGSPDLTWQLDLHTAYQGLKGAYGWTPVSGDWIVIKMAVVVDNYGNKVSVDPSTDPPEKLSTFGDALNYLDKKLA